MILAISAEPSAIPPNPNIAATIAIIKKITISRIIIVGCLISSNEITVVTILEQKIINNLTGKMLSFIKSSTVNPIFY